MRPARSPSGVFDEVLTSIAHPVPYEAHGRDHQGYHQCDMDQTTGNSQQQAHQPHNEDESGDRQ
jgi:hypothetical protein